KEHLTGNGDLGSAIYWCDTAAEKGLIEELERHTKLKKKSILSLGALDIFTGLRSFVRLGANRGYHLLLAEKREGVLKLVDY
ncbi:MAG: hypothetical protein Q9M22_05685, partial [Mariprofundaceae bacterium]|nr:hypothetical protein [Mariprofundaceae bacterium]